MLDFRFPHGDSLPCHRKTPFARFSCVVPRTCCSLWAVWAVSPAVWHRGAFVSRPCSTTLPTSSASNSSCTIHTPILRWGPAQEPVRVSLTSSDRSRSEFVKKRTVRALKAWSCHLPSVQDREVSTREWFLSEKPVRRLNCGGDRDSVENRSARRGATTALGRPVPLLADSGLT